MRLYEILFIAVALSMDALAVSVACGIQLKKVRIRHAALIAFAFGFFQLVMPLAGAAAGAGIRGFIAAFDHWVIFAILAFIGGKMIYESIILRKEGEKIDPLHPKTLLFLSVATSIDAFAVGISVSLLAGNIFLIAAIIGSVTFAICFIGVFTGDLAGHFFEEKIEAAGGIMLILIGVKILVEHLS